MEEYARLCFVPKTNTSSRRKDTFANDSFTSYTVELMSYSYRRSPSESYGKEVTKMRTVLRGYVFVCGWV